MQCCLVLTALKDGILMAFCPSNAMLDCMFQLCKLEGHPVNPIHHQICGDLKMNQIVRMIEQLYVYFFPQRCFQTDGWMIEKLFIFSHFSWEPRYLFVWPTPQVCPLYVLICRKKYFCMISDTSAWSTYYIIRILVPTLLKIHSIPLWYFIFSWQSI